LSYAPWKSNDELQTETFKHLHFDFSINDTPVSDLVYHISRILTASVQGVRISIHILTQVLRYSLDLTLCIQCGSGMIQVADTLRTSYMMMTKITVQYRYWM